MSAFVEILQLVADGEPVDAAVANRALGQLQSNILFLRNMLDGLQLGTSIVLRDQTLAASTAVGQPVYFKTTTNRFEKAIGVIDQDAVTKAYVIAESGLVWGLVLTKASPTVGDVILSGVTELDISAAVGGDVVPGTYYLSNAVAGRLVPQRPPVGIAVVQVAAETVGGKRIINVNPKLDDLRSSHAHYKFELSPFPAGDHMPPAGGSPHTITGPDPLVEGWLPADHVSFGGLAPDGAVFGYNIAVSPLVHLWPPQPLTSASLEICRGVDGEELASSIPLGSDQLAVIDNNGIWWMSACQGDVPWPEDYDSDDGPITSTDCTTLRRAPTLTLWMNKPVFTTDSAWVTSLQAADNSGLIVTCVDDGQPATAGNLLIDFDSSQTVSDEGLITAKAIKAIVGKQLQTGPVVTSVIAGSSNVLISSDVAALANGARVGQLQFSVDFDLNGREVAADLVKLDGAEEYPFEGLLTLAFFAGRRAAIRGRIQLPLSLDFPAGTKLKLRFMFANLIAAQLPAELFSLTYRRIPHPATAGTPLAIPMEGSELSLGNLPAIPIGNASASEYFFVDSLPFDIAAGDIVMYSLTREGDDDGHSGDVLLLRQAGVYVVV